MDHFTGAALQVEYDPDERCISIQATPAATVTFRGKSLMGEPFKEVRAWIESLDSTAKVDGAGLISKQLGIGLYARSAIKQPELPVEAVIVFVRGYYERAKSSAV